MKDLWVTAKKMGPKRVARSVLYRLAYPVNTAVYKICLRLPVNDRLIVLESEGDLCDNAYALYHTMKESGIADRYKVVWLVDHKAEARKKENAIFVTKNPAWVDVKRAYYLATCKWYIYDHCNVLPLDHHRKEQTVVYLGHGFLGFKKPKGSHKTEAKRNVDAFVTTGDLAVKSVTDYYGIKKQETEIIKVLGYPRLDWFYGDLDQVREKINKKYAFDTYDKVLLWMPTFRKSVSANLSEDYLDSGTGLPLLVTAEQFEQFNSFLKERNILCVLKLHHLQAEMEIFQENKSNILILRDDDLRELDVQLYQFVPLTDALISDYSSISMDYLMLNKPMLFILDDYEEYNRSRGINYENIFELMVGDHIYTTRQLEEAVIRIHSGEDICRSDREALLPKMHLHQDGDAGKRILDHLGIR